MSVYGKICAYKHGLVLAVAPLQTRNRPLKAVSVSKSPPDQNGNCQGAARRTAFGVSEEVGYRVESHIKISPTGCNNNIVFYLLLKIRNNKDCLVIYLFILTNSNVILSTHINEISMRQTELMTTGLIYLQHK